MLGVSMNPAFIFVKVSPPKKHEAYQKMTGLSVQRAFEVSGDMDAVLLVEREKLDEVLRRLSFVEGVHGTRVYVATRTMK